jgi:hypothetical protein
MALRVGEHRYARAVRHVHGPHHPAPTETLDLAQRRLEVTDLHVEGDVVLVSDRGRADAAVDAPSTPGWAIAYSGPDGSICHMPEIGERAALHRLAVADDGAPVAQGLDLGEDVAREEHGPPA